MKYLNHQKRLSSKYQIPYLQRKLLQFQHLIYRKPFASEITSAIDDLALAKAALTPPISFAELIDYLLILFLCLLPQQGQIKFIDSSKLVIFLKCKADSTFLLYIQ